MKYLLITSLILLHSCSPSKKDEPKISAGHYFDEDSIFKNQYNSPRLLEIYCLCSSYDPSENKMVSICTASNRLKPADIIFKENLYFRTNDSLILNRFSSLYQRDAVFLDRPLIDSRIVLLVHYENRTDTIDYYTNNLFTINNKVLVDYKFNLIDTIISITNIGFISCTE